jgi:hypothetical protein
MTNESANYHSLAGAALLHWWRINEAFKDEPAILKGTGSPDGLVYADMYERSSLNKLIFNIIEALLLIFHLNKHISFG